MRSPDASWQATSSCNTLSCSAQRSLSWWLLGEAPSIFEVPLSSPTSTSVFAAHNSDSLPACAHQHWANLFYNAPTPGEQSRAALTTRKLKLFIVIFWLPVDRIVLACCCAPSAATSRGPHQFDAPTEPVVALCVAL